MSINQEAYLILKKFEGMGEISGKKDNPLIELMHRLTKLESATGGDFTDEIPWCSSFVNFGIVLANIKRNPKKMATLLESRGLKDTLISLFNIVGLEYDSEELTDTGVEIIEPTWSARSKSWDSWGNQVKGDLQPGDIVRLTRSGGGHVAFFEGNGLAYYKLFGGNQSNSVNTSRYLKSRFVTARRA